MTHKPDHQHSHNDPSQPPQVDPPHPQQPMAEASSQANLYGSGFFFSFLVLLWFDGGFGTEWLCIDFHGLWWADVGGWRRLWVDFGFWLWWVVVDPSSLSPLFVFHSTSLWLWVFFFFFAAIWADLILVSNCSGCGLIVVVIFWVVLDFFFYGFFFFFFLIRWCWWMWVCAGDGCRCCCGSGYWWPLLRQWWLCCCCCWWWWWELGRSLIYCFNEL